MNCQDVQESVSLYLYGELDFQAEELFEEHLAQCPECTALLERERIWHASARGLGIAPSMELLGQCRRDLSRSLRLMDEPPRPSRWTRVLEALDISPSHWSTQIAVASLLIGLGFGAARILEHQPFGGLFSTNEASMFGMGSDSRLRGIQPVADPSKLTLVFEDLRTRRVTVSRDDPETVRVLAETATSELSEDPALRADVIDSLRGVGEPVVLKALLTVAGRDPNPGLRLKALDVLGPYVADDPETMVALVGMLAHDKNYMVRMKVTGLLSQVQKLPSDPNVAGTLQGIIEREPDTFIRMHCQQKLREIKASVETY